MAAEAFLLKLGALAPAEQRAALCGLPDAVSLTRRFENAWPRRDAALGGVPFLTKDLYFRTGHPTFAGSTFLPEVLGPARRTSTLPAAFEQDAGAIECGRTQLNEFAFGLTGENPHYGDCPHPIDGAILAGGSSSGAAFAVARGLVPFALATDTAGSIRVPCGYCGVWGLRLSPDILPVGDLFPLSPGYDTPGWIAGSAQDLAQVSAAVLGEAPPAGAGLWAGDLGWDSCRRTSHPCANSPYARGPKRTSPRPNSCGWHAKARRPLTRCWAVTPPHGFTPPGWTNVARTTTQRCGPGSTPAVAGRPRS
ncbi:amidase 1 [Verrucomicrobiota bacterium]|nr:amidase 1 [Verrucomicrobiota bacterium]